MSTQAPPGYQFTRTFGTQIAALRHVAPTAVFRNNASNATKTDFLVGLETFGHLLEPQQRQQVRDLANRYAVFAARRIARAHAAMDRGDARYEEDRRNQQEIATANDPNQMVLLQQAFLQQHGLAAQFQHFATTGNLPQPQLTYQAPNDTPANDTPPNGTPANGTPNPYVMPNATESFEDAYDEGALLDEYPEHQPTPSPPSTPVVDSSRVEVGSSSRLEQLARQDNSSGKGKGKGRADTEVATEGNSAGKGKSPATVTASSSEARQSTGVAAEGNSAGKGKSSSGSKRSGDESGSGRSNKKPRESRES
ncbi:hypothetical protein HK104_001151 [Borealophlyctis nickersoniae]|nr:hypothetical protein HK104_001151 [Borealophlyctis nickersoniae]